MMKSVVGKYKSEIDSKSDLGKSIQSAAKGATVGISSFTDGAQDFAKTFQERFKELIQRAKSDAASAESEKTPGYYNSALHQLETAEWMLTILIAFNGEKHPMAIMLGEQLTKLTEEYKTAHAKLVLETQRVANVPEERYQGSDLESLRKDVTSAGKRSTPRTRS
jgi:HEPN domain-containing protein